jgi:sugar phosphate isomerase/epimerase
MNLGFVSAILPDLSLEEVLTFASETDYQCVEVMCWPVGKAERRYAGVTHIDVADLSDLRASEIKSQVAESGVTISGLGYYPNPLSADREEAQTYIDHLKKLIEGAPKLNLNVVNTFIGRDPAKSIEGNWSRFKEVWEPLIKHAEAHGVRIGIENCPMYFSDNEWPSGKNLAYAPAIWRRMFEEIPSDHFGLNFDPSHFIWMQMDYVKAIREFGSKFVHVHAKDARINLDGLHEVGILGTPLQYHTPKLPGLGDVDWGKFFSALSESDYRGPVCVEVEDRPYEQSLERRKGSLRQSHRYLSQFTDWGLCEN